MDIGLSYILKLKRFKFGVYAVDVNNRSSTERKIIDTEILDSSIMQNDHECNR